MGDLVDDDQQVLLGVVGMLPFSPATSSRKPFNDSLSSTMFSPPTKYTLIANFSSSPFTGSRRSLSPPGP